MNQVGIRIQFWEFDGFILTVKVYDQQVVTIAPLISPWKKGHTSFKKLKGTDYRIAKIELLNKGYKLTEQA